jgi:uncharacterized membrane protein
MPGLRSIFADEKNVHLAFQVSLVLKASFALAEIVGGVGAYSVSQDFILSFVQRITQEELGEDPRDLIANYLLRSAEHLSVSALHFAAFYLLSHGAIKLWLIIGLLREKISYYPIAIAVFALFIVYQLYRFSFTHSIWLMLITIVDIAVIGLTWHEYKYLRRTLVKGS